LRRAKYAHLGDRDLEKPSKSALPTSLASHAQAARARICDAGTGMCDAPGQKDRRNQRDIEDKLERRGQFNQGEVAAGIFEHHGFVYHGEFEVRGGIVDRIGRSRDRP